MSDKNNSTVAGIIAPLIAKIEEATYEKNNQYKLDDDSYNRILDVYQKIRKFALQNDGGIKNIDITSDTVKIVTEVPSVDLFREGLNLFSELLTMVDSIDVSANKNGYLFVEIGVSIIWRAV